MSKRATLIGVYNMNKGYADFKQINIMYQNDEYSIVEANTRYGLECLRLQLYWTRRRSATISLSMNKERL